MDVDADDHGEERIPFSGMDSHIMKMVIIQDPVVYPFAGSPIIVDLLIFIRASRNGSIKTDIPFRLRVDAAAISRGRTLFFTRARADFTTGKGTAPFTGMLLFTVPPVDHAVTGHTQGRAILINQEGAWNGSWSSAVRVQVDERPDIPFLAEAISSIIVMCRIQADIPDGDIRVDRLKFTKGNNGAYTVVPSGIQETDMHRQINANVRIMKTEHIKGMAKIKGFFVAVPAPVSIGIREMPATGAVWNTVLFTFADFMPVRGGMGMDAGAVAGKRDTVLGDKPILKGG